VRSPDSSTTDTNETNNNNLDDSIIKDKVEETSSSPKDPQQQQPTATSVILDAEIVHYFGKNTEETENIIRDDHETSSSSASSNTMDDNDTNGMEPIPPPPSLASLEEQPTEDENSSAGDHNNNELELQEETTAIRSSDKNNNNRQDNKEEEESTAVIATPPQKVSKNEKSPTSEKKKKRRLRGVVKTVAQFMTLVFLMVVAAPFVSEELWQGQVVPSPSPPPIVAQQRQQQEQQERAVIAPEAEQMDISMADGTEKGSTDKMQTQQQQQQQEKTTVTNTAKSSSSEPRRQMVLSFVSDAVHKVGPAVIRIDTETQMISGDDTSSSSENGGYPSQPHTGYVQQGQGSGLIFSSDGLILTNAHVVEDATKVTVTLTDGRIYQAKVLGQDEIVDIAVIKILLPPESSRGDSSSSSINDPNLPTAKLGDSDKLTVGQIVIAVGSPGGLDNTVTMGIISGLERSSTMVGIPHKKVDYIQTDAAINPGNR
jgi:hypothetical protein